MLRASIETQGEKVDLRGLTDGKAAGESSIFGAAALVGFAEATLGGNADEIAVARDLVRSELGSEALVDAAAVIGNFERMVRVADGTGIPLDAAVNVATEEIRAELGIDAFASEERKSEVATWQRLMARAIDPLAKIGLRWQGRRASR
jgi:hypothetical protein